MSVNINMLSYIFLRILNCFVLSIYPFLNSIKVIFPSLSTKSASLDIGTISYPSFLT